MSNPFFSIIIPVYNVEKYLRECLDSVLRQSFSDYEIVLVDDGSRDHSEYIYKAYAMKYADKVTIFRKQNEGPFFARKDGIKRACGRYYIFLDSDDMLRSDALGLLHNEIEKSNADMVIYNGSFTSDYKTKVVKSPFPDDTVFNGERKKLFIEKFCGYHTFNNLCLKCISRELIDLKDYETHDVMNYGEDLFQSIPLVDRAETIVIFDEPLYYYRQHEESLTHNYKIEQFNSLKGVSNRLVEYSKKWEKQYGISLRSNVRRYCGIECYRTVKNVVKDDNRSVKEKIQLIKKIQNDKFYEKWKPQPNAKYLMPYERLVYSIISRKSPVGIFILNKAFSVHDK